MIPLGMNRSWLRNQGAYDAANLKSVVDDDASVRQLADMLIPSLGYHSGRARSRVPAKLVDSEPLLGVVGTVLERSVSGGENRDDD